MKRVEQEAIVAAILSTAEPADGRTSEEVAAISHRFCFGE